MIEPAKAIAVIPARGGSKRVPKKNVRPFCGRPIIEFAIETALDSGLFAQIIVSTDSDEIADCAAAAGATVPFVRPDHISGEFASTASVFSHALEAVDPDHVAEMACCLYATTPFLDAEDLVQGRELLLSSEADCVFAATGYDAPIERAFRQTDDGLVEMVWPEQRLTRTNDLPEHLHDAGQFYWVRLAAYRAEHDFFTLRCAAYMLPRWRAHDIDTEEDWIRAERVYRAGTVEIPERAAQ